MRGLIALMILTVVMLFGAAFWMVFDGSRTEHRQTASTSEPAAPQPGAPKPGASTTAPPAATPPPATPPAATPQTATPQTATSPAATPSPAPSAPAAEEPASGQAPGRTASGPSGSSPLRLSLPIACTPGEDCWVVNYVDDDPGPGARDYRCGRMSYDGHKGTDIALRTLKDLSENVPVLAAAPGKVVGTRDGMQDISIAVTGREPVRGRNCGNGVRIDHGGGWATQYCHMRRGSIVVQTGQTVETGQVLGAVGLSGMTEFPHVHIQVEKDRQIVDPFRGVDGGPECGPGKTPLWVGEARGLLGDPEPLLLDAGFGIGAVNQADAAAGTARITTAGTDASALLVWTRVIGIEPGDTIATTIAAPDGRTFFENRWTADEVKISSFRYVGKKRPNGGWPTGVYTARVMLERNGRRPQERTVTIRIGG